MITDMNQYYLVVLFKLICFVLVVFLVLNYRISGSIICYDLYGVFLYRNKGDFFPGDAVVLIDIYVFSFLLWLLDTQPSLESAVRRHNKNINMGIYLKIELFWVEIKKPPKHANYFKKYCSLFILNGLRFYTSIRTRYIFEQNLYLIPATFFFLAGYPIFLIIYFSPVLFLTLLLSISAVKSYFLKVYGQDCLKNLGWNFIDIKKKT